jgi:hypothetical protein
VRQVNAWRLFPFFCEMKPKTHRRERNERDTLVKVNYTDRENGHTCVELERRSPERIDIYRLASRGNQTCYFHQLELTINSNNFIIVMIETKLIRSELNGHSYCQAIRTLANSTRKETIVVDHIAVLTVQKQFVTILTMATIT